MFSKFNKSVVLLSHPKLYFGSQMRKNANSVSDLHFCDSVGFSVIAENQYL